MTLAFETLHVLIVEDRQHMRRLLNDLLQMYGVRYLLQAANGVDAMDILLGSRIDLVISDLSMEPMDGIEFTKRIRQSNLHFAKVPVIIVSGYSERSRIAAARDAGASEFLVKPISSRDLKSRIEAIMESPRRFISGPLYVGPDRRRNSRKAYLGPLRRKDDLDDLEIVPSKHS
jgi:CheY-like chemotaxis protein